MRVALVKLVCVGGLLVCLGCNGAGSAHLANPFMAPDLVPPPATRPPAPGTAAPYYNNGGIAPIGATAPPSSGSFVGTNRSAINTAPTIATTLPPATRPVVTGESIQIPTDNAGNRIAIAEPAPRSLPVNTFTTAPVEPRQVPPLAAAVPTRFANQSTNVVPTQGFVNQSTPRASFAARPPPVTFQQRILTPLASPIVQNTAPVAPFVRQQPVVAAQPNAFVQPRAAAPQQQFIYPPGYQQGVVILTEQGPMVVPNNYAFGNNFNGGFNGGFNGYGPNVFPPAGTYVSQGNGDPYNSCDPCSGFSVVNQGVPLEALPQSRPQQPRGFNGSSRSRPSSIQQAGWVSSGLDGNSAVRPASSEALLQTAGDSTPRTSARYGFGRGYGWLRGRLEYLEASDQWKLRYVPIDGRTDEYGGSVIFENPTQLRDLNEGDFVQVRGRITTENDTESGALAPRYRLASIQPLAD